MLTPISVRETLKAARHMTTCGSEMKQMRSGILEHLVSFDPTCSMNLLSMRSLEETEAPFQTIVPFGLIFTNRNIRLCIFDAIYASASSKLYTAINLTYKLYRAGLASSCMAGMQPPPPPPIDQEEESGDQTTWQLRRSEFYSSSIRLRDSRNMTSCWS